MMIRNLSIIGIAFAIGLSACSNEKKTAENQNFDQLVTQLDSMYSHHIKMQQADSLSNIFLSDAVLLTEGEDETKGIRAIQDWYKGAFDYGLRSVEDSITSIIGTEETIVEVGKSKVGLMIGDADTLSYENHKYIHVWHKQANGQYKLARQMWNNDAANEK